MTDKFCAEFRFYAELNDFLPFDKRQLSFQHYFSGKPSVKDTIEAIGIPHPEVDLILVNGNSVDFNYLLKSGDKISVYPVFESFDIGKVSLLRKGHLQDFKFVLDVHLGRLAKYLRMLGFDTLYRNDYQDEEIIELALIENRIIITRDIGLLKNKRVTRGYWLRHTQSKKQLAEIMKRFDLQIKMQPFKRCLVCNNELFAISKEKIINKLLPKTKENYEKFSCCCGCKKIYWKGSHYQHMQNFLSAFACHSMDESRNDSDALKVMKILR